MLAMKLDLRSRSGL